MEKNIHIESVPGSWELPIGVSRHSSSSEWSNARLIATSQIQAAAADLGHAFESAAQNTDPGLTSPFDAVIAIGVLIKGETMHFEYIADAVSKGLMRISLDTGIPVIFGVLTVLKEEQAMVRAGMIDGKMHNHGVDWGNVAVEMGSKGKTWAQGKLS